MNIVIVGDKVVEIAEEPTRMMAKRQLTVDELRHALQELPGDLPVNTVPGLITGVFVRSNDVLLIREV